MIRMNKLYSNYPTLTKPVYVSMWVPLRGNLYVQSFMYIVIKVVLNATAYTKLTANAYTLSRAYVYLPTWDPDILDQLLSIELQC